MESSIEAAPVFSSLSLVNARSLSPAGENCHKLGLIKDVLKESGTPAVAVAVTETWLKEYISDAQVAIPGYDIYRSDRVNRTGGGCALYIHDSLAINDKVCFASADNNLVAVYVEQINTVFAAVYRSESTACDFKKLISVLQCFIEKNSENGMPEIFVQGDFNLPLFDWVDGAAIPVERPNYSELQDFMDSLFLSQVVEGPTRGENTLDLVLTNRPEYISNVQLSDEGISDHLWVKCTLSFNPLGPSSALLPRKLEGYRSLDIHSADFAAIDSELAGLDWDSIRDDCVAAGDEDGTLFVEVLRDKVFQAVKSHCPAKKATKKHVDKVLRHLRSRRRKLNKRLVKNPSSSSHRTEKIMAELREISVKVKERYNEKAREKERKVADAIKLNPKFFYSHVKQHSKVKSSVAPLERPDGSLTVDPVEKAELLQLQFSSVFSDPADVSIEKAVGNIDDLGEILCDLEFSPESILGALKEIKPHSASPPDCIPAVVLKRCCNSLSYPIWLLWSASFSNSSVPSCLKLQYITPIFKKGVKSKQENYRPVSITSHLTKVFEKLVKQSVVSHLDHFELHSENQHGFRKGRSTMSQLLTHIDFVLGELCAGREVDVVYLDFSKAFDRVDIDILLAKLSRYGVGGKILEWIRAWIKGRHQCVVVDGVASTWIEVLSGVAQGSVLGPLLFLIYILDLEDVLNGSLSLTFADDTKLSKGVSDVTDHDILQQDILCAAEWAAKNNMLLHESKFQLLSYRLNQSALVRNLPFTAELSFYTTATGCMILPEDHVRDLGVILSADGSWSKHISGIVRKASLLSGWVFSVFRDRSPEIMLQLYKTMVRPLLEYCCLVWCPSGVGDIKAIENVQRCFTRRLDGMKGLDYWARLKELKLMSLQRRRQRYMLIHVWKTYQELVPNSADLVFQRNPRLGVRIVPPPFPYWAEPKRANQFHHSFGSRAARLWNRIPASVNSCVSLSGFKSELGKFLDTIDDCPPTRGYPVLCNILTSTT